MDNREKIRQWIEEILTEEALAAYFLIDLHVSATGKVEVFLDGDAGIDLAVCRRISRSLEERLDQAAILGESYTLEVSSPGVSRPLRLARQYPQHLGRTLLVNLLDDNRLEGRLLAATPETLTLEISSGGKGKKKVTEERSIPMEAVREALVKISFK